MLEVQYLLLELAIGREEENKRNYELPVEESLDSCENGR